MVLAALVILINSAHSLSENSQYYNEVVNASEILQKINKGEPFEYDHVIVRGDLKLSKNQSIVRSPIRSNDSEIDGVIYLITRCSEKQLILEEANSTETNMAYQPTSMTPRSTV